jgi:hypothetical protein
MSLSLLDGEVNLVRPLAQPQHSEPRERRLDTIFPTPGRTCVFSFRKPDQNLWCHVTAANSMFDAVRAMGIFRRFVLAWAEADAGNHLRDFTGGRRTQMVGSGIESR